MTESFGGIVLSGGNKILLRKPKNNFDGYSWTFAKTTCNLNEAPEAAAIRAVKEKTGYEARILAKLSGVFKGSTGSTSFYLMDAKHPPSEINWQTERICWETFENAEKLIKESTNLKGRERDLEVLRAVAEEKIKIPYVSHPNVQPEDFWRSWLPMPERNVTIPYQRSFSCEEMDNIMRGFYPTVQEQHWIIYFTGKNLRLHRSWTGILIFDLPFVFNKDGSAHTSNFIVNRNRNDYKHTTDTEDIKFLTDVIEWNLIRRLTEPAVDGFVLAIAQALQPKYLGSPKVISDLLDKLFEASHDTNHNFVEEVANAFIDTNSEYIKLPEWHTAKQFGANLIKALALNNFNDIILNHENNIDINSGDNYPYIVSQGIYQIECTVLEIMSGYEDESEPDLVNQLTDLKKFLITVLLGTNDVFYPNKTIEYFI